MSAKKKRTYVIFAGPEQHSGPSSYIAADESITNNRNSAAVFFTHGDAEEWAAEKGIKLDGASRYIGLKDFFDFELEMALSKMNYKRA